MQYGDKYFPLHVGEKVIDFSRKHSKEVNKSAQIKRITKKEYTKPEALFLFWNLNKDLRL